MRRLLVLSLGFSSAAKSSQNSVTDGALSYLWSCTYGLRCDDRADVRITCFIFVTFFAESLPVLFAGQFLIGLPFGFYNCLAQAYASEIAPLPLRGIFTMYNQSCWCTGQLLTAGILYGFRNGTTKVSQNLA